MLQIMTGTYIQLAYVLLDVLRKTILVSVNAYADNFNVDPSLSTSLDLLMS